MAKLKVTKALLEKHLSKEVSENFDVDNSSIISLKFVDPKLGLIDFTKMTKKTADYLVKRGCKFISPKKASK